MASKAAVLCALAIAACDPTPKTGPEPPPIERVMPATPSSTTPIEVPACIADMVLVDGSFCPGADERCTRHIEEYASDPDKSERCL